MRDLRAVWSTAAAVTIGVVGAFVLNTLPVFLVVMARARVLDAADTGGIALAEMGGVACGSILCTIRPDHVARMGLRRVAAAGLVLLCAADLATIGIRGFVLLWLVRLCAGIGAGIAIAITYAMLAQKDSARELAIFNVAQQLQGWVAMSQLGSLVERFGESMPFLLTATLSLLALPACLFLPGGREPARDGPPHSSRDVSPRIWQMLAGVFLTFAGLGAVYAYLAFMGVSWGGTAPAVEQSVSTLMLGATGTALVVSLVGSRFGFKAPMYIGYAILLCTLAVFLTAKPLHYFLAFSCLFGFAWNLISPYQFEFVLQVDSSPSAAMLVNAATYGGLALGPAVASLFLSPDYVAVNALSIICIAAAILLTVLSQRKQPTHA